MSSFTAMEIGSIAIKAAMERANISGEQVDEVYMGNVLQAGLGQNPARQAAIKSGKENSLKIPHPHGRRKGIEIDGVVEHRGRMRTGRFK